MIDFFLSETAHHADVVLPGSLHEEDEGTATTGEGRIVKINKAVDPPGDARRDWEILIDLAGRLGKGHYFPYDDTEQIFEELRLASAGGTADYRGATWQRIEEEMGLFWPVPEDGHPGTPRLFEGGRFYHPDGRARFHAVPFRESAEVVDADYPVWLTTGRVVSQYLSGTQTRRIGGLVAQYPEPLCEMHPHLAEELGVADGDLVTVTSRRGPITVPAHVVSTIRPDTVFIPYHWPGRAGGQPAHQPGTRPDVEDARVQGGGGRSWRQVGGPTRRTPATSTDEGVSDAASRRSREYGVDDAPVFVIDQSRCIGCEACVQACMECGTHRGRSLIHLERIDRSVTTQTAPMVCMHCEDPTCAHVCPADAIKQTESGVVQSALKPRCIGCSNCVLACPFGVPKYMAEIDQMMKCDMCTDRTVGGPQADVRIGLPERGALVRHARGVRPAAARLAAARLPVRAPGGADQGVHGGRRRAAGPARRARRHPHSWLDDPFGLGGWA